MVVSTQATQMTALIQEYFVGEKSMGWLMVPLGLALLGFAYWVYRTQSGGFMWSLVVMFSLLGLGLLGGSAFQIKRNEAFRTELAALYQQNPKAFVAKELPRMTKVNKNWLGLKIIWAALLLVGLGLIFGVKKDWAQGLALAFFFLGATAMFIDVFAERRAITYTQGIEIVAQQHP